MAKWDYRLEKRLTFEDIRQQWNIEQVLRAVGIEIDDNHKCTCPFHDDTTASMYVNEKTVYCFGCGGTWDSYGFIKQYMEFDTAPDVFAWFTSFHSPTKTPRKYGQNRYDGPVEVSLVEYWHSCLQSQQIQELSSRRLLTEETIHCYQLGWRPDWDAYVIPFWRGEIGNSEIDIVQFRMLQGHEPKYIGLKGHNRGSVMNAFLLEQEQPYVVILLGAYDSILAYQDGLIAVGLNGSTVFTGKGGQRLVEMFDKQTHIIVVPDNTETEFKPAQQIAQLLGTDRAVVKYFPDDLPKGTDYIDYRVLGYSVEDFMAVVLDIKPFDRYNQDIIENLLDLIQVGDALNFIPVHLALSGQREVAANLARALAERVEKYEEKQMLWKVIDANSLCVACEQLAQKRLYELGGW